MHFRKRLQQNYNFDIVNEIKYVKPNLFITQHKVVRINRAPPDRGFQSELHTFMSRETKNVKRFAQKDNQSATHFLSFVIWTE
jgi:hypothetical protein